MSLRRGKRHSRLRRGVTATQWRNLWMHILVRRYYIPWYCANLDLELEGK